MDSVISWVSLSKYYYYFLVVTLCVVCLILVAARRAVSRQFELFLLSLYSTNSDFVVLDLTVKGLVALLWIYSSHFFMYYLMRSAGFVGVAQGELPGGPPSEFDSRRSIDDDVRKYRTVALRARRALYIFA